MFKRPSFIVNQKKCNQQVATEYKSDLYLENNVRHFRLKFICSRCEMEIYKEDSMGNVTA